MAFVGLALAKMTDVELPELNRKLDEANINFECYAKGEEHEFLR